jgi:hypothetical protein
MVERWASPRLGATLHVARIPLRPGTESKLTMEGGLAHHPNFPQDRNLGLVGRAHSKMANATFRSDSR